MYLFRQSQQIVLSGIGGQGVLFITKILAEVAMNAGFPVLVSETHGMAQRGGTVASHVKIGDFKSPLIRPGQADVLICFHEENISQHEYLLKKGGMLIINSSKKNINTLNATRLALEIGVPISANLILLGFALAKGYLFCGVKDVEAYLKKRDPEHFEKNLRALEMGANRGELDEAL